MKKILLLSTLFILGATGTVIANSNTYTPEYVEHLKTCTVHSEKYSAEIPTDEPNTPVIHLKSTENINGWKDGKCITTSTVFSIDMNQDILTTKCAFSEEQLKSVTNKMTAAQKGDAKAKQELQAEMTKLVQDTSVCQVQNLLKTN